MSESLRIVPIRTAELKSVYNEKLFDMLSSKIPSLKNFSSLERDVIYAEAKYRLVLTIIRVYPYRAVLAKAPNF